MEETDEDLEWARSVDSSIQIVWVSQRRRVKIPNRLFGKITGEITRVSEII